MCAVPKGAWTLGDFQLCLGSDTLPDHACRRGRQCGSAIRHQGHLVDLIRTHSIQQVSPQECAIVTSYQLHLIRYILSVTSYQLHLIIHILSVTSSQSYLFGHISSGHISSNKSVLKSALGSCYVAYVAIVCVHFALRCSACFLLALRSMCCTVSADRKDVIASEHVVNGEC